MDSGIAAAAEGAGDSTRVVYCPAGSGIAVRVLSGDECRGAGAGLFPLEWFFSITLPDGTERLFPAAGTVVRAGLG